MKKLPEDRNTNFAPIAPVREARKKRDPLRKRERDDAYSGCPLPMSSWRSDVISHAVVSALPGPCRTGTGTTAGPSSTPDDSTPEGSKNYAVKQPLENHRTFSAPTHLVSNENSCPNRGDLSPISARLTMTNVRSDPVQAIETLMELSRNRNNGRVIEVFRLMQLVGVDAELPKHVEGTRYTIYTIYIAVCQAFIRTNMQNSVADVITHMRDVSGVDRTYEFYESVMRILAAARKHREAIAIYDQLKQDGMEPQPHMLTCLVNFSFDLGLYQQCRDFFLLLKTSIVGKEKKDGGEHEKLSTRVVMTQFRVFSKLQLADEAVELLKLHESLINEVPDKLAVNVTLGILVNKYRIDEAWKILNTFPQSLDTVSFNTIMKGYARTKRARDALALLDQMESRKGNFPMPNLISYNTVADAFMRIGQPDSALSVVHRAQENGIKSDMFTCSILVKGIETTGNADKYLTTCCDILHVLPAPTDTQSTTNQVRLFQCVLNGCCKLSNSSKHVEGLLQDLQRNVPAASLGSDG